MDGGISAFTITLFLQQTFLISSTFLNAWFVIKHLLFVKETGGLP